MTRKEFYSQGLTLLVFIFIVGLATTFAHAGECRPATDMQAQGEAIKNICMFLAALAVIGIVVHVVFPGPYTSDQVQRDIDRARLEELRLERAARREREDDR